MVDNSLVGIIAKSSSVTIYIDGDSQTISNSDDYYQEIIDAFWNMCSSSHEMPALGVSLHEETIRALDSGVWIEFSFDSEHYYNDMPFDSLLINVNSEDCGFNIIRKNDGRYEGRCYYISLQDKDMSGLKNILHLF